MSSFPWVCGVVPTGASVIGTPVSMGSAIGTGGASNIIFSISTAVPSGALIFVGVIVGKTTSISVSSVADATGNTYSRAKSSNYDSTSQAVSELWYSASVGAVTSGTVMTATFSSTSIAGANVPVIVAGYATGLTNTPLDKTASSTYTPGTAYSSGSSGTLSQAKELAVGFPSGYTAGSATVVTEGSGFTQLVDRQQAGGNQWFGHLAYQIVAATTALNYQPTLSVNAFGGSIIATFEGS